MQKVMKGWIPENPFGLNESLLAMKAYAPYHQLFAISQYFSIASNQIDRVPNPCATFTRAKEMNIISQVVSMAANSLTYALEIAANEPQPSNRVFSPQNWIKTKSCLSGITAAIKMQIMMQSSIAGNNELKNALMIPANEFEYRWQAD